MKVLVTGAAGFIGMHVCEQLLVRGDTVVGLDNLNGYYDVSLKEARLARLTPQPGFRFLKLDIADRAGVAALIGAEAPSVVIHLAAQVGVRNSIREPHAYIDSNLTGFGNVLEACRQGGVGHFVFASSSSVYGANVRLPYAETDNVDHPVSLYAATKKANELMAHSYSHLYALPATGLRFFTVYGPWGRPDMAPFLFTKAIFEGKPINVFNHGKMRRDFTYIDDIVEGVVRVGRKPPPADGEPPYRIFNIGNNQSVELLEFIETLEEAIGKRADKNFLPMQPGDVPATAADTSALEAWVGFKPHTPIREGVERFVAWYRQHYRTT